ncbi:hypothetical protein HanOQP8_Chr16g0596961 [Helianthus annuus]|nr:hypothetical protein HanOQP8_Chr16g0596961 [Helianthus annuus]
MCQCVCVLIVFLDVCEQKVGGSAYIAYMIVGDHTYEPEVRVYELQLVYLSMALILLV